MKGFRRVDVSTSGGGSEEFAPLRHPDWNPEPSEPNLELGTWNPGTVPNTSEFLA
jgi:hypothetical protein